MIDQLILNQKIRLIYFGALIIFMLNKFIIRPWAIANELPAFFIILFNSLPNFTEAVIGTIVLTELALQARKRFPNRFEKMTDTIIYLIAAAFAAIYVITQELKIHNLGGRNVYDPYDVLASIVGILFTYMMITKYQQSSSFITN